MVGEWLGWRRCAPADHVDGPGVVRRGRLVSGGPGSMLGSTIYIREKHSQDLKVGREGIQARGLDQERPIDRRVATPPNACNDPVSSKDR